MNRNSIFKLANPFLLLLCTFFSCIGHTEIILGDEKQIKLISDFRLRYENDWDSETASGMPRQDRERLRLRARLAAEIIPMAGITLGARIRTGAKDSQQSPHVTLIDFEENPVGDQDAVFDKWYARYSGNSYWIWGGRNSFPYWKQNELFWDDDVTPAGIAASYNFTGDAGNLSFTGGYFTLPDGGVNFNGNLAAGQITFTPRFDMVNLVLAGGVFVIDGDDDAINLLTGNGARDYTLWMGSAQFKFDMMRFPITLGVDVMHNSENYSATDPDPFTVANRDQNDGYVLSILAGKARELGDWQAGYYYAHLETLAVHASFAQDDWMRWGTANQTDASNFKGHEIRMGITLSKNMNLLARLYLVDAITSVQDGKRFRVDLNYEF